MTTQDKPNSLSAGGIDFGVLIGELIAAFIKAGYANKLAEMLAELLDLMIAKLKAAASQSEAERVVQDIIDGILASWPDESCENRRRMAADAILQYFINKGIEPHGIG